MLTFDFRHDCYGPSTPRRSVRPHYFPGHALGTDYNYTGVVDPTLRVYGLKNVRVVDAGIIPITVGVATQPTVYALAEKVSLERTPYTAR